jgi:hypothetical protein
MPRRTNKLPADLRLYYIQRAPPTVPGVRNIQTYFPSLEVMFPSLAADDSPVPVNPTLAAMEMAVSVSASGDMAVVENMVTHSRREVPVWMRPVHLLEPLDCAEGIYVLPADGSLPAPRAAWQAALRKLNDPYNEAYTDATFACMASRLVETGRSPHWCRFYGTMNGRTESYRYNITDDMPDLEGAEWFAEGLRTGAFEVWASDPYDPTVTARLERPWENVRAKLVNAEGAESLSLESESCPDIDTGSGSGSISGGDSASSSVSNDNMEEVGDEELEVEEATTTVHVRKPRVRIQTLSSSDSSTEEDGEDGEESEGEDDEDSDYEDEESDLEFHLTLKDFPVQLTLIERCDGTMDDLMEDEVDPDVATDDMRETMEARWTAWLFQVVAGLAVAQKEYDFVHNDLHTNNVMWCGTGETHLYYHVTGAPGGDRWYRVPTYGRIMKIIDFGRATFRPPIMAPAGKHIWVPDAYAKGADAWGQYNFGPYMNREEPKVMPNKSFDLCRLAVAILDTLWLEKPADASGNKILTREPGRVTYETVSPLWNLLWLWLTDKEGKNVLLSPDDTERYPQFDLYCAIARNVTNAVPGAQLTLPLFDRAFRCAKRDVPADAHVWRVQTK